jgi:hypothetical protein
MANHPAAALPLRDGDRERLEEWQRSRTVGAGLARRARQGDPASWIIGRS